MRIATLTAMLAMFGSAATLSAQSGEIQWSKDWNQAVTLNTPTAYEEFLKEHPRSPHTSTARRRIAEQRDWEGLQASPSVDGFRAFRREYPSSKYDEEAELRIEELEEVDLWEQVLAGRWGGAQLRRFIQEYPQFRACA